ncbi:hypothetical protein H9P43_003150 [Blastocladiella emersonii ATCC 22665]|nr:hypothetical protein H9P43_003150 [Blastocladiella emersonii ATCC 22665]
MKVSVIALLAIVAVLAGQSEAAANCGNGIRVRKDYRDLTDAEWNEFIKAVKGLKEKKGADDRTSAFEEFTAMHAKYMSEAHADNAFALWHRHYLRVYEDALVKQNPAFKALPYWDWSADYALPHKASLWTAKYLGSSGGDGTNPASKCIPDGPFANLEYSYPDTHCLRRGFSVQTGMSDAYSAKEGRPRFHSPAEISNLITSTPNFDEFHDILQYNIHATPHTYIGGSGGDMYYLNKAPNDPAFTHHHAYVDYLLTVYLAAHPKAKLPGGTYAAFGGAKASDAYDTLNLCYKYEPYSGFKPKPVTTAYTKPASTSAAASSSSAKPASSSSTSAAASSSSASSAASSSGAPAYSTSVVIITAPVTYTVPVVVTASGSSSPAAASSTPTGTASASASTSSAAPTATGGVSTSYSIATSMTTTTSIATYPVKPTDGAASSGSPAATTTASGSPSSTYTMSIMPIIPTNEADSKYNKDTYYGKEACPYLPPADSYLPPPPKKFVEAAKYPEAKVAECQKKMAVIVADVKEKADKNVYLPPPVTSYQQTQESQAIDKNNGVSSDASAAQVASVGAAAALAAVVAFLA